MRHLIVILFLFAPLEAPAEYGHLFPPLKPEELVKIKAALPQATVKPSQPRKLLVFFLTEGYVHASIPYCNEVLKEIGEKTGAYTADFSEDMAVFTPDKLNQYDAILFNNTTGLKFADPAARQALLDYVKSGKGVAAIHSATDNFPTWPEGQALLGGKFDGHPWGAGDTEAVKVDDPAHPVVAALGGKGFWINDEIYQMGEPYDRSQVRVLLSLDMSKPQNARDPKNIHRSDNDFPICWVKQTGDGGRVFYCSLGHNPSIYWTPQVLQVYLDGIQYALGDLPVDATPSAKLSPQPEAALAPETPRPINK
jgi:type 1 glutamine amidotransferase